MLETGLWPKITSPPMHTRLGQPQAKGKVGMSRGTWGRAPSPTIGLSGGPALGAPKPT